MALKLVPRGPRKILYITGTVGGDRYSESTGTASRAHADARLAQRHQEILDGIYLGDRQACLFAEAVTHYLRQGGEGRYLQPLLDAWGALRVNKLTPRQVAQLAEATYGHASPATVRRQLYVPLNAVLRAAHRGQLGPLIRFEPPKVKRKPVSYADDLWLARFFQAAHFQVAAIVLFMSLTAARVTEACRLRPEDVRLDRGEAVLRLTKSGRSRRVPLAPVLIEALERAIAQDHGTVFGYAARWSVNQAIGRVCARAGLPYLSSHQVGRHAFAARLLARGHSLKLVQEGGGWASIQVVAQSYGHLEQQAIDGALRDAGSGLPALPKLVP